MAGVPIGREPGKSSSLCIWGSFPIFQNTFFSPKQHSNIEIAIKWYRNNYSAQSSSCKSFYDGCCLRSMSLPDGGFWNIDGNFQMFHGNNCSYQCWTQCYNIQI